MSRITLIIIGAVLLLFGALLLFKPNNQGVTNSPTVASLRDAHGLGVDRRDSSKVYIATHTGLLMMQNGGELVQVSKAKDDYMGFSAHPTDANTFYTSGHPSSGGNLGFQKSIDGGQTWKKVSNGANGPVDFHAMAVSQVDPTLVYGWYRGQLQRSYDEGKTWGIVNTNIENVIVLATSTSSKDVMYAGTNEGMFTSSDQGANWTSLQLSGAVTSLAVNPKDGQKLIAFSQTEGLLHSNDTGKSWQKLNGYSAGAVLHIAYDPQNPPSLYLINQQLEIYKTTDSGVTWKKIR